MQLSEIIIDRIKREGPISFCDFMEMCLYFPEKGYYTSMSEKFGKSGDYFTSPTISPVFGELIGKQIEEMWVLLEEEPFTIVEYGAGTGALCEAVLVYLKANKKLFNSLKYCIIEKSDCLIESQKMRLPEKVSWHASIKTIPGIKGCILSNELVDNFAVHRVEMREELKELYLDYNNKGFVEILKPARNALKNYLKELKVDLEEGFRTEINLEAIRWMKEIAECLQKGYVLTIDYGYPSFELYSNHMKEGTLRCYNRHKTNNYPYHYIGTQDITSHVNFSALCLWGFRNGLDYCGFTDQARFLTALGFSDHLKNKEIPGEDYLNLKKEMFLTQTLVKDMGSKFKVLIQRKNTPNNNLTGLSSLRIRN